MYYEVKERLKEVDIEQKVELLEVKQG